MQFCLGFFCFYSLDIENLTSPLPGNFPYPYLVVCPPGPSAQPQHIAGPLYPPESRQCGGGEAWLTGLSPEHCLVHNRGSVNIC